METMKSKMADILMFLSWGEISEEYFGRSRSWIYQKMNGNLKNGTPTEFTDDEKEKLRSALTDLAGRIINAAKEI